MLLFIYRIVNKIKFKKKSFCLSTIIIICFHVLVIQNIYNNSTFGFYMI